MIDGNAIIHILDMEQQESYKESIGKIFSKYFEHGTESGPCSFFKPREGSIKIRDLQGWTDVIQITRQFNPPGYTLANIRTKASESLLVTRDQLIPVYNNKSSRGFHGEVLYEYNKCAVRIFYDGMIKSLRTADNQFVSSDLVQAVHISGFGYTYGVNTKSGFFNANNLYLLSDMSLYEKNRK